MMTAYSWVQRFLRRNGIKSSYLIAGIVVTIFVMYFISRITALSGFSSYGIASVPHGHEHTDMETYKAHAESARPKARLGMFQLGGQIQQKTNNMGRNALDGLKTQLDKGREIIDQISNLTEQVQQKAPLDLSMIRFKMDQFNISVSSIASLMGNVSYLRHISRMMKSTKEGIVSLTTSLNQESSRCHCVEVACHCCVKATLTAINLDRLICVNFTFQPSSRRFLFSMIYDNVLVIRESSRLNMEARTSNVCTHTTTALEDEHSSFPLKLCALLTDVEYEGGKPGRELISGCLRIAVRVGGRYLAVYPVGCFGSLKPTPATPTTGKMTQRRAASDTDLVTEIA